MGGIAFKDSQGKSLASGVERQYVQDTLDDLFKNHLKDAGVLGYEPVGSTGKKSIAGDLDIAVQPTQQDIKLAKTQIYRNLLGSLGADRVKVIGPNLTVLYPIKGDPEDRDAQVDLMIAPDLESAGWLMAGVGDEGIKGIFRNVMLGHIAAERSKGLGSHEKMTVATPGGLGRLALSPDLDPALPKNKRKFKLTEPRTTNPQEILDGLGIPGTPAETASFEGLVNVMTKDATLKQMLSAFKDYLALRVAHIQHPQAQRVLKHVETVMSEAMIRNAVRQLLEMKQNKLQEKIVKIGDDELYDLTDDNLEALRAFIRAELKVSEFDPDASRQSYIESIDAVRGDKQFSTAITAYPDEYRKIVLDYLMKLEDGPEVIAPLLFSLSAGNPAAVDIKPQLLDILHYNEGQGLGRGELLTPLLYDKSSWVGGASATHDVDIGKQAWEIKHHRSFNEPFVFGGGAKSFFRSPNKLASAIETAGYKINQLQTMGRDESLKAIEDIATNFKPVVDGQTIDTSAKLLHLLDQVAREHVLPKGEAGVLLYQSKSTAGSPTKTRFVDKDSLYFYAFGGRKTGRYLLYAPDSPSPSRESTSLVAADEEESQPNQGEDNLSESVQKRWGLIAGVENV